MAAGLCCPEVVIVSIDNLSIDDVSRLQVRGIRNINHAIYFWRIAFGTSHCTVVPDLIDHHIDRLPDFLFQTFSAYFLLQCHESVPPPFFDLFGYGVFQRIGCRAFDCGVLETAHSVEFGFSYEIQKLIKLVLGFTRKPDNEG